MKIHIVTDDGELIDTIKNVQELNFDKPFARLSFLDDIEEIINRGRVMETIDVKESKT